MPFTPAHTVAVLPFVRSRKLCATALVAGSMSPDFEYFIRMNVFDVWGHHLAGIFLFDLPVTFVSLVLFHKVVKRNFIDNLPAFFQRRFGHLKQLSLKQDIFDRPLTFVVCACLGAATHVVWDGFTHKSGYFVKTLTSVYDGAFVTYEGVHYPLWYALQHISTWVGLAILVISMPFLKPMWSMTVRPKVTYWILLVVISAATVAIRFQFPHRPGLDMWAISSISGACIAVILLGLLPGTRSRVKG